MIADETTTASLGAADAMYARLLYASGFTSAAIERTLRVGATVLRFTASAEGWARITPHRPDAVVGVNVPVLVRCPECGARFGEALNRPPRPCPHCGRERLVLL